MSKVLFIPVAIVSIALIVPLLSYSVAHACSPGPTHLAELEFDDTPECLSHNLSNFNEGSVTVRLSNRCSQEVELEVVECGECDTHALIAADEQTTILLEGRRLSSEAGSDEQELEDGDISVQHYRWTMGEQEGRFETWVEFRDRSNDCSGCHCASTTPWRPDGLVFILLLLSIVALRQRIAVAANAE